MEAKAHRVLKTDLESAGQEGLSQFHVIPVSRNVVYTRREPAILVERGNLIDHSRWIGAVPYRAGMVAIIGVRNRWGNKQDAPVSHRRIGKGSREPVLSVNNLIDQISLHDAHIPATDRRLRPI